MSYQKKSLILQQLEQAIRKKAQEKSRNKQQVNRALQGSIEKKKNVLKTATNKEARVTSIHKNSDTASKPNLTEKPVSIFNNEHLNVFDTNEFKAKKYNNRRLDKLVSLIQYMISSSEKALRYISSTNFQAEFALKLYRSDRQNLVNELKNLNFDDIIDSQRTSDKALKPDQAYNMLLEQNNKLKKQILILQKEAESYHNKVKDSDSFEIRQHQKEINKLRQMLRKLIPFEGFKQIIELLQKENKFQIMSIKSQQNSKKTTEIQIVISSLQNERSNIIQNLCKATTSKENKTDRAYKLGQIQAEKQQLQKQLAQMKVKLAEIIDSSKSINEIDLYKKNIELITEKLTSLHKELSPNSIAKRSNEQLIQHIRTLSLNLQQKNNQLSITLANLSSENEVLKEDIERLTEQKKQLQNDARSEGQTVRIQNMHSQIQKLRDIVDELGQGQQISSRRISQLEEKIRIKDDHISDLTSQLSEAIEKSNDFKGIINELNEQIIQVQNQFNRTISQKTSLAEKLRITQNEIINNNYSKEELKIIQNDKESLAKKLETANNRNNYLQEQIRQLQSEIIEKQEELEELQKKVSKENADLKNTQLKGIQILREVNALKQELEFVRKQKQSAQKLMEQQRQRHISEYEAINKRLHEAELLNIKISKEKMEAAEQLEIQRQNVESLNQKIDTLQEEVKELQDQIRSLTLLSNEALYQKEHSKDLLNHVEEERQILKNELTNAKQQMQDHSEIIRSKNKQYVNLLRQILKGLLLDPSEYADKSTFEELLQFGSQQVVQIRKRQREEQSNKRKNSKRDYENVLSEFNQPSLQQCKAQLFEQHLQEKNESLFMKKQLTEDKIDIDEFNELKEQANDSMMSEQVKDSHPEGANLSQFNELQNQKMSESVVSNEVEQQQLPQKLSLNSHHQSDDLSNEDPQYKLPEKLSLNSVHHSREDRKSLKKDEEGKHAAYELTISQIEEENPNLSQFNHLEQHITESMVSEKPIDIIISQQRQKKQEGQIPNQNLSQELQQNYDGYDGLNEGLENDSMLFQADLNLQILPDSNKIKPKKRPQQSYSKHTLLSIALKDEKLDLDEFQEVKSVEGNHSFVSSNDNADSHREYVFDKHEEELGESDVRFFPLDAKGMQNKSQEMKLQEFKEIDGEPLGQSMISDKQNEHNIDEFGDLAQSGLSQSMISIQEQKQNDHNDQEHPAEKTPEQLGLEQFGEVQNKMNDSMLSQHKSDHGLSQFGELPAEGLNESLLSEKQEKQDEKQHGMSEFGQVQEEKQHGMSQFGEVQEDQMNDSLLSENYNLMNSNRSEEKNHLDEFDEYKEQKMSQSMISEKQGVISRLKSDESFESP